MFKPRGLLFIKGVLMGMADLIPGVSGGTMALITGIYQDLIFSIGKINFESLSILRKQGIKKFFIYINAPFLFSLALGILTSILLFSKFISYLLHTNPINVWAFFFGLISAGIILTIKRIKIFDMINILLFIFGAVIIYGISILNNGNSIQDLSLLFLCGIVASIAMILPGISGAFILLVLGGYDTVIDALGILTSFSAHNHIQIWQAFKQILVVGFGAIIGLITFSKGLNFIFGKYKEKTLSLLSGFMLGSLYKVWPWKNTININGTEKNLSKDVNINPFIDSPNGDLYISFFLIILGFILVSLLDKLNQKKAF